MLERQENPERALVVYAPRGRSVLVLLGGMTLAAFSALLLVSADPFLLVVGLFGVAFFGLCSCYGTYRLVRRRPVLRVTAAGITDSATLGAVGFVPWSRVLDMGIGEIAGQRMISIHVDDPEQLVRRMSALRRVSARANTRMTGTPMHIPGVVLPLPVELVMEEIVAFRPERA